MKSDELKRYEDLLLNENMLFELNAISQMVVNKDRVIIRVNKKFSELFGYSYNEILGKKTALLTPTLDKFREYEKYFTSTKDGIIKSEELQYKKKDGTIFWVKLEGNPINQQNEELFILWSFIDVTNEVKYRQELELLASTDSMTKLYNRRYFNELSKSVLKLDIRNSLSTSVIILDIDRFKVINDTFGHKVGDDVIISLANQLKKHFRKSDIISRWGGEEFVVLLPQTDINGAMIIAKRLRDKIENSSINTTDNQIVKFTISLGVSQVDYNKDNSIEASIICADKALYEAKENGRNRVVEFKK